MILAKTGMRRGELLGLRHSDIDYEMNSLRIEKTLLNNTVRRLDGKLDAYVLGIPKTPKSRRMMFISESAVKELKQFRIEQMEDQLKLQSYKNEYGLVFTEIDGSPISPNKFSYQFKRLIKRSGIERNIRLHDLRHTVASFLLNASDSNPKAVQELLGHSNISTTLDTYSHISIGTKKDTAVKLEGLVKRTNTQ